MINLSRHPALHFLLWWLDLAPAQTQTTSEERECLRRHATDRRRLVEIGVWHGVNTRRLRSVMASDGILYAIDPFPAGRFGVSWERRISHKECNRESNGQVQFMEMTSAEAAEQLSVCSELADFIFVDGDHSYEGLETDWTLWAPRIAVGGIVALHDSRSHPGNNIEHMGSVQFTRETILTDPRFTVIDVIDSMTVLKRNDESS